MVSEKLLHVSGIITVLVAAVAFVKGIGKEGSAETRFKSTQIMEYFWDYTSQVLSLFLFFLLGVATGRHDFVITAGSIAGAIVVLILSRMLIVYSGGLALRLLRIRLPLTWQHVMMLGGLRGGVSAALIMMIPAQYPYHTTFLCLAFVMIAFAVIIQPVVLKIYLNRIKLAKNSLG